MIDLPTRPPTGTSTTKKHAAIAARGWRQSMVVGRAEDQSLDMRFVGEVTIAPHAR
jgi:hypothetical protein